jgi:hypothetical protein
MRVARPSKAKPTSLRFDEDIQELLLAEAEREQRSVASTVNMVLRRHYESTGELEPLFKPRSKGKAA